MSIRPPASPGHHLALPLLVVTVAATLGTTWTAHATAAGPELLGAIRERVERQLAKPSVHDDPDEIKRALADAGVAEDMIVALHHAISKANLPGMVGSLDAFLFFTRDPQWLSFRKYFAEFLDLPEVVAIDAATMRLLADYDGVVTLPSISEIPPKTAGACRLFGESSWGAALEFPGVAELTPAAAEKLARCEALLSFPHLENLSPETARALAKHRGMGLFLGGLKVLPDDVAAALAETESERGLLLPDLVSLDSVPLAKRLARQDHVTFPSVRTLSPAIAAALRGNEGGELSLPAITEITPEVAKQLVGAGYYWLSLGGAAKLSPEAAAVLAKHQGQLVFSGPDWFSAEAAKNLVAHDHVTMLPHVDTVPVEVVGALADHQGSLILGSVSTLTADAAAALVGHEGPVYLTALERLAPDIARILAPRLANIHLPAFDALDLDTAVAFATHARDALVLEGVTTITPEIATELAAFKGPLSLPAITTLSAESARALSRHRGFLGLESLNDLGPDVAIELGKHDGGLGLFGINSLSAESGKAIATAPGNLMLPGVCDIAPEAAAALLARTEPVALQSLQHVSRLDSSAAANLIVKHFDDVSLHSVTALTGPEAADIARVLVRARGSLALPSLEDVSPQALEILLGRPNVELPDLADVKIVQEPGQRVGDDFVDPRR